jgi:hypothetical protein
LDKKEEKVGKKKKKNQEVQKKEPAKTPRGVTKNGTPPNSEIKKSRELIRYSESSPKKGLTLEQTEDN